MPRNIDNAWVLDFVVKTYIRQRHWPRIAARMVNSLGKCVPRTMRGLANVVASIPPKAQGSTYDAVVLYSGGKDSSYMLMDLARRNIKVCAWMLNQGYQSPAALDNAKRLTDKLGVPLIIETPPRAQMDGLFRLGFGIDASHDPGLVRAAMTYGSACWPCFATIAAKASAFCEKNKVPFCFIGTQEGQNRMDLNGEPALSGRGLPRMSDLVEKFMSPLRNYAETKNASGVSLLSTKVCDTVVIPFYEFVKKPEEAQQISILSQVGWQPPHNTGACSTNCMINDLGRHVMRTRFGFDLYQIIDAHERRIGNKPLSPDGGVPIASLDHESVARAARMIGMTDEEGAEYNLRAKTRVS